MKNTTAFSTIPDLKGVVCVHHNGNTPTEARHLHESLCVGAVLAGTRKIVIKGNTEVLDPGDVIAFAPGQIHACPNAGHSSYTMLCISTSCIEQFGFSSANLTFPSPRIEDPALFKRIVALADMTGQTSSGLEKDAALLDILETLSLATASEEKTTKHISLHISLVRQHIEDFCTDTIRLDGLAEIAGISPCRLNRCFSSEIGMPPHEYQTLLRIREVKYLISAGKGLAEASDLAGFSDQSHMARCFKKVMGMTPGTFLKGVRNGLS